MSDETQPLTERSGCNTLLPRCDVCSVEYVESYEGPCQEPRGEWLSAGGWSLPPCPGRVSWRATAEAQHRHFVADVGEALDAIDKHAERDLDHELHSIVAHYRGVFGCGS